MLEQLRGAVLADRATPLLVAAVRASRARTVLLPGIYCPDVAVTLSDAGFALRYYDLDATLSPALPPAATEGTALIWYHPFGLYRPPPPSRWLIVDACHALRTLASCPTWHGVTIVNFRKEFGWACGAAAAGLHSGIGAESQFALTPQLPSQDFASAVAAGRDATETAKEHLADYLPALRGGEVLTHLPLLSHARDAVIARLRANGLGAWRWLAPLPAAESSKLAMADTLRQLMLLVPLPVGIAAIPTLDRLVGEDLLPWPQQ